MNKTKPISRFLPTSKKEMDALGWEQADVILFSGDAYIDHPSFGAAVIGRILESAGYKVAIVPQPNWRDDLRDFKKLGEPRLFFAVTSGSMDSMVNHYTANKRLRSDDAYTPGGKSGFRPDYAVNVYSNIIKQLFPETPLVLGGVEASLRRLTHYDFWKDELLPSILLSSKADLLVYGMGERTIVEVAYLLNSGKSINTISNLPQTAFYTNREDDYSIDNETIVLNSFEECLKSPRKFGQNFMHIEVESNKLESNRLIEPAEDGYVIVNQPLPPASTTEMDGIYNLPYMRSPHPRYRGKTIPAWEMIKFSINIHRGCFGGCSFCTISAHQGKFISSRSQKSILDEVETVAEMPDFKGYLSDLGGPSANMYMMQGIDLNVCKRCKKPSCIFPKVCPNLNTDHKPLINLYKKSRAVKGIKKAFIGSGIRYDLFADWSDSTNRQYFEEVVRHHVSGRLKVAPEHTEEEVLKHMRKPSFKLFVQLKEKFDSLNRIHGLNQQLTPYFISSHPGCTIEHMQKLSGVVKTMGLHLEQVQDFTPTPMTLASTIFYTGIDPYTGNKIFVEDSKDGKLKQRELFFAKPYTPKKPMKRKR